MKPFQLGAWKARLTLLIIAIVAFGFSSGSIGQEAFKIGVVNTEEVLKGSDAATKATDTLRAAGEKLQKKLERISEEVRTLQEKKAKTELFVEQAQTADLDNEILQKQQEFQREREMGQQALLDKERELLEPIYKNLEDLIINVGKAENYDIILEKRLITLYVKEKYDLTKRLIELMNEDKKNDENNENPE
ncbi:OmpH family outer membrane protein [Candidatus Poribacteria bacterium]|nr:OmpH family outer membrane protein [Candidatus Poribacteria bacterium]